MSLLDLDKGGRIPQVVRTNLGPTVGWKYTDLPTDIEFVMTSTTFLATGFKGFLIIPDWVLINNWIMMSDLIGTAVVDIYLLPLSSFLAGTIPGLANSITGTEQPNLQNQACKQGFTLAGWNTGHAGVSPLQINQNDVLGFNINSVSNVSRLTITLQCVRVLGQG